MGKGRERADPSPGGSTLDEAQRGVNSEPQTGSGPRCVLVGSIAPCWPLPLRLASTCEGTCLDSEAGAQERGCEEDGGPGPGGGTAGPAAPHPEVGPGPQMRRDRVTAQRP